MELENLKPRVLYVDDEEENLLVFKSSFRRNYEVFTALSAAQAEAFLKEQQVDIILSDQRMPGKTGVEFLKGLPQEPENIRMLLTGFSDLEAVVDALNTGKIHRYLTKPWERDELQQVIDEALSGKRASQYSYSGSPAKNQQTETNPMSGEKLTSSSQAENNTEISSLRKQVDESYKNMHLLSEIGQEIISNLTIEGIIESSYENVNALMDASSFGIGIFNSELNAIEFNGWIEKGEVLPYAKVGMDETDRLPIWCFKNDKEIIINDFQKEYNKYIKTIQQPIAGDDPESILYIPLRSKNSLIGVITSQSFKKNAYNNYHLNILRNISVYVATAIENSRAYNLIQEHRKEIEEKNNELEHKIHQRTEQLLQKNDELEGMFRNVKLLSEIGQQITSSLSLEKIIETVYENVNKLMDASAFAIGVCNQAEDKIEIKGAIEKGQKLPTYFYELNDENRNAVWCFKHQKEVIINDYEREYNKYIKTIPKTIVGERPESILFLPLISEDKSIGIISVQSFKKHSYNQYHIDILRSLSIYATIAIENARSYHRTTTALAELKSAQTKLVESEKMASLGVLTAGVAHEINNPVNFISNGIVSLKQNFTDVEMLIQAFMELNSEQIPPEQWLKIQELRKKTQPAELMQEIQELFDSIKNGANRTSEIVKGLRNFSRLDENEMKKANLEEGIENTLVILNNRVKNRVAIIKEFGNIPDVMCYPGQLNQVFMNLLHNASDAINGEGEIRIKTSSDDQHAYVTISDSGQGMPEEIRSKIFEPFFTTKPVGKGTGLGLSIAYGIIEKHKGSIEVESEPGKGTTFLITLPLL